MMVAGTSVEGIDSIKDMFDIILKKDPSIAIEPLSKVYDIVLSDVSTKVEEGITPKISTLSDDQKASFYHDKALAIVEERKRLLDMGINQRGATMYFLPDEGLNPSSRDYKKVTEIQERSEASTLEFIDDLISRLQKCPEALAKLFPQRVYRLTQKDLSQFWANNINFVRGALYRVRKLNPEYKFNDEKLDFLKEKSIDKFGAKAIGLIRIITEYNARKITIFEFLKKFNAELGRISGAIEVTKKELSILFGMEENYISSITSRIEKYPDFKFSKEVLRSLEQNLDVLRYSFRDIFKAVSRYEFLNPDLKEYSRQQYTIDNPNFFSNIFKVSPSYWFGFLTADGYTSKGYTIGMELSTKDQEQLDKFADAIGYDRDRIKPRLRFHIYKGELKLYEEGVLSFSCKPMWETIEGLGLYGSKSERKSVPSYVKEAIEKAKKEADNLGIHWSETHFGKVAHAWLLGFYDGDGEYHGGYSANVGGASKELLLEIKELFEIKNEVKEKTKPGAQREIFGREFISKGYWILYLGPNVFKRMLSSYDKSLDRKRAQ